MNRTATTLTLAVTVALSIAVLAVLAAAAPLGPAGSKPAGDPYPLDTCAVAGTKFEGKDAPVVFEHEEREFKFCCKGCLGKFKKDPAEYIAKVDRKIVKQQLPYYPSETCLVMGDESLKGPDADPVDYVAKNRLVRFCCKGCIRKFDRDPERFLRTLDEAVIAGQKPSYPTTKCLVSGEALGSMGEPIDMVVANRLVRLCCKGCVRSVKKDPTKYLAALDEAQKKSGGKSGTGKTAGG